MYRSILAAIAAGVCLTLASARPLLGQEHTLPHDSITPGLPAAMATMNEPLDVPHSRMGSGTSWIPDASSLREFTAMAGKWMLMGHGDVVLYGDHQGTPRGADQIGSTNWLMLMAMRNAGGGMLRFNTMLSAEPLTVAGGGYPLLLQSGESYQGLPLHDRQHPHNLFMELSALYERPVSPGLGVSLYVAPVGEPALGPVAFMHRPSAVDDPFASIAHHWQDVTHITFGVLTAGVFTHGVKLEVSWFNGREPDERRYAIELRPLDSWSVRLDVNPAPNWSLNASYGFLRSPEGLHPEQSQHRIGTSMMYTRPAGRSGEWATALIYGANQHLAPGQPAEAFEQSLVLESDLRLDDRNALFGRVTFVRKTAEDLVVAGPPETRFNLGALSLGYVRGIAAMGPLALDAGIRGEIGLVPAALRPVYGTGTPAGLALFVRLRPRISARAPTMGPAMEGGMDMPGL
ncbi:MAG: hypothetical protein ACHQXA_07250 [Gemmatimonadales bacterium]